MMTLSQLHDDLTTSEEVKSLLSVVAVDLHNRSIPLGRAQVFSADDKYTALAQMVHLRIAMTDMTSSQSIAGDEYQGFRLALWFGQTDQGFRIDRAFRQSYTISCIRTSLTLTSTLST